MLNAAAAVVVMASSSMLPGAAGETAPAAVVSRNLLPDGSVGVCRSMGPAKPGWLNLECRTQLFPDGRSLAPIPSDRSGAGAAPPAPPASRADSTAQGR